MTKLQRVTRVFTGLLMLLTAWVVFSFPKSGLYLISAILSISMTIRGLQTLLYYFRMARHMVGGQRTLYRGIIFLDLGILTGAMTDNPRIYIILYLAALHAFGGVIEIMRGIEAKSVRAPSWKYRLGSGLVNITLAAAVLIGGFAFNSVWLVTCIYSVGLAYTGIMRIVSAFRRTAIVYIQ